MRNTKIQKLKSNYILGSLLCQSGSHELDLLEDPSVVVTGTDGHVGGGDGWKPPLAGTCLSGLGLPTFYVHVILSPSSLEEGQFSLFPPKAPTCLPTTSSGKITAGPTLPHKFVKSEVTLTSSMPSCCVISSSSLPSKLSQTSPRLGQGRS